MVRPTARKVAESSREIGRQITVWRKLLGLTAEQVSERAGISRSTFARIERGDAGVNFGAVLSTARALGFLESMVRATDPYETDFGRARADETLPQRVRS